MFRRTIATAFKCSKQLLKTQRLRAPRYLSRGFADQTAPQLVGHSVFETEEMSMEELVYHHRTIMRRQANTATRVKFNEEDVVEIDVPEFIGDLGVNLNKLKYFALKKDPKEIELLRAKDENNPSYSWMRVVFPFETSTEDLGKNLVAFNSKNFRLGRLLEIMDFMAGRVCYKHCFSELKANPTVTIVTAAVDNIEFYPTDLTIDKDMVLEAYITSTGRSSMEVRIDILNHKRELYCTSYYVMVARNKNTQKSSKVPSLSFENEHHKSDWMLRNELGRRRQEERKKDVSSNMANQPPNSKESEELHKFLMASNLEEL